MSEIDPMVRRLMVTVAEAGRSGEFERLRFEDAEQLTERLKRPSRAEFHETLQRYIAAQSRSLGLYSYAVEQQREALLDLVCGPEPKPRGKVITFRLYEPCMRGNHAACPGISKAEQSICNCPTGCHKETSDV